MAVETTVVLLRHGVTDWHSDRRVLGQRDIGLNDTGKAQAEAAARALASFPIADIVSSPLVRSVQSAEIVAKELRLGVTRDPRLVDFRVGKWEGMTYDEVEKSPEYRRFVAAPLSERIPGGEDLGQIRDRAVSAVEQSLRDLPGGESLLMVTHAGIVRVLLSHYLGMNLAAYHLLRVSPGSLSLLAFGANLQLPRVLAVNWMSTLGEASGWPSEAVLTG